MAPEVGLRELHGCQKVTSERGLGSCGSAGGSKGSNMKQVELFKLGLFGSWILLLGDFSREKPWDLIPVKEKKELKVAAFVVLKAVWGQC